MCHLDRRKVNVSFGPQEGKCVIWTAGKVNVSFGLQER